MSLRMPKLEEGRVYRKEEVAEYIGLQDGSSDYNVAVIHFPRNLKTWEHDFRGWRAEEEVLLQYQVYPLADFEDQLRDLEEGFNKDEKHRRRVQAIADILLQGQPVFPVFMQQNDPQRRIIEGMHRAVALKQLESPCLPAFLTGYRNWFTPDELVPGFEREEEIAPGTLRDVYGFFMHAASVDHRGIQLALFGGDRLGRCDEAFVASFRGKIIGAATIAVKKGKPRLDTVYVLKQFRGKGVGYRLCEKSLDRLSEAGVEDVYCEVMSPGMEATLRRLGRERPDLRTLVKERVVYLPGEEIEIGLTEDDPEEG
jgi:ribosomal protein S18 acetylase RimI-like enzyme